MPEPQVSQPIDLSRKLARIQEHYQPKVIAEFNGHDVMVAKLYGDFVWHQHPDTDDFFLVLKGHLGIRLREGGQETTVHLNPGQLYVVPRGVEHQPFAEEEVEVLLIEQTGTLNTGDPKTAAPRERI